MAFKERAKWEMVEMPSMPRSYLNLIVWGTGRGRGLDARGGGGGGGGRGGGERMLDQVRNVCGRERWRRKEGKKEEKG